MSKFKTSKEIFGMIDLLKVAPATDAVAKTKSFVDCAKNGFIFVYDNGTIAQSVPNDYYSAANKAYGCEAFHANRTFYKSFSTVRDISPEQHLAEQLMHYFSTYGLESIGLNAQPWIPTQDFQIDGWDVRTNKLVVIRLLSNDEDIVKLIDKFAASTVAPSERLITSFKPLMKCITIPTDDIKSFELQVIKHELDDTVPTAPISFLRYLVYQTTGQTLLIKNQTLCNQIKRMSMYSEVKKRVERIFNKGNEKQLATIFLRYKPIFLAYKAYPGCRAKVNRLRRLADKYHKPLSDVSVQNVTKLVNEGRYADVVDVIDTASNRELVKIYNAVTCRVLAMENHSGVYAIRNGKTFVKENGIQSFEGNSKRIFSYTMVLSMIQDALASRLKGTLEGKKFYLPEYIDYAVPVTEKQFTGNIPWGTRIVAIPNEPFTVGVCWFDQRGSRVDIDLHLNSATEHFGWNSRFRDGSDILYTGDQTSAPMPDGAAEAYWFNPEKGKFILGVNLFSGPSNTEYKLFMTKAKPESMKKKYTYDASSALFPPIPMNFADKEQQTIGLFTNDGFYFYGGAISSGVVPTANYEQFIDGLSHQLGCTLHMIDLLVMGGAVLVSKIDDETINLSPEALTTTTLLDIIDNNK